MARPRKPSDKAWNAKRRALRAAKRTPFKGNPYDWTTQRVEHDTWGRTVTNEWRKQMVKP